MSQNMDQLEKQLDNEEFQEIRSMAAFKVLETQFQIFIKSRIYLNDEYVTYHNEQHIEQPKYNIEGEVDQNAEQCHDTCPLPAKLTDNQTTEHSNQSLEYENICLKKTVAQFQKDFLRMEAHCVNLELKYQNQALKEGQHGQFSKVKSIEAKVKHDIDVIETINIELEHKVAKLLKENETLKRHYKELFDSIKTTRAKTIEHTTSLIAKNDEFKAQLQEKGFAIAALKMRKPVLQPHRNQSVVRQPTAFKSERPRISKPRVASQVDVNNDLSKPVTTHYLPKERESAIVKPHHMIAPSSSRYSSNDMVHNHYLEEAKKKTQESGRNSRPSVMPSAKSQSTANEHSRNSRNFFDSKHFVCSTCQKCVFNANHDSCVTKFLNEVNSRAKVPSNKTTNRNKPVEQTSFAKKPERQIPKGHRFSIKKTSVVHEKTITPRSCLRWKPTGKIFKTVGLRWVPTRKIFTSSTTKVDSEPPNSSNEDITNPYECKQTLNVSACTLNLSAVQNSAGSKSCSSSRQDSYITTRVGITIPPSHNNVEGIMPTKIELTLEQSQQGVSNDVLAETGLTHNLLVFTKMNSDTEDDIIDPLMQCTTLPSHSSFSQQKLVSFVTEIHMTSIDFLTPKHPSDTQVFTMKMEILLEPTSNKLSVGTKRRCCSLNPAESDSLPHAHTQTIKKYYKPQDSRIMKAQDLKTQTSVKL
ncbi:hypothetical protein Tco_0333007 [Tanacetum coccineum]